MKYIQWLLTYSRKPGTPAATVVYLSRSGILGGLPASCLVWWPRRVLLAPPKLTISPSIPLSLCPSEDLTIQTAPRTIQNSSQLKCLLLLCEFSKTNCSRMVLKWGRDTTQIFFLTSPSAHQRLHNSD